MQEILSREMISRRIRSLRIEHSYSQETTARFLGMSRGNYSQIELGNQFPTYEILFKLAVFYNKSYEWILHGRQNASSSLPIYELPRPVSGTEFDKIRLVKNSDYYNYLTSNKDREYIDSLESLKANRIGEEMLLINSTYRVFEVSDYGMAGVVQKDDIVTARNIENCSDIIFNDIYVLVTNEEILIRRVLSYISDTGVLVCKADNSNYPLSIIKVEELQELWHMGGVFSTKLNGIVEEMGRQLKEFERSISVLRDNVESLEKKVLFKDPTVSSTGLGGVH